jgi:GT2 family glycosyltransferase
MSQSLRLAAAIDPVLWRIMAFSRSLERRSPGAARLLRRAMLLIWWTATFQLHVHARYWLRARRLRRAPIAAPVLPQDTAIDPRDLCVPMADDPLVSVIVPTFGQVAFTLRCLDAVARNSGDIPYEVLVVDDAFGAAALESLRGIRLICNEANLGFLHTCNKAAAMARGRYLVFLNNDTRVLDNWLEPMLALFRDRPDTGAVGSKLLYPDGRLQEAGGIIWQDASGWNFGRLENPDKPEYNYVREVDYCSGAALMVDRAVFAELGGFDPRYAPAYYEDTDLCFRLRRMGLKTLYQPASRVVHYEGVSHGRDTSVGIKSYQAVNRATFASVWSGVLRRDHYPNGTHVFRARERTKDRRVALVIDHYVPTPDRDAGSRAICCSLQALRDAGYAVKFWPHNLAYSPGYTEALQSAGIEVFYGPHQIPFHAWIQAHGAELDVAIVSRPDVADDVLCALRRHSRARIVYYGHDLHFRRMRLQAELTGDEPLRLEAERMRAREFAIWEQADLSVYLSDEEAQIASALRPDLKIGSVVPYCFGDFAEPHPAPASREIVFVAGFGHPPNADAAVWFVREILPAVRAAVPDVHLSVIGSNPTRAVQALAGDGVSIHPDVSDAELAAAYARARVAVVPLRCGAGVKLKVVEALRQGVPLVTTSVGGQGLPGLFRAAAIEESAPGFAAAAIGLLRDDALWEQRSRLGVDFARTRFSRTALLDSLLAAAAV